MKTEYEKRVTFRGEEGDSLEVGYDNRGDPYRTGISLWLTGDSGGAGCFPERVVVNVGFAERHHGGYLEITAAGRLAAKQLFTRPG